MDNSMSLGLIIILIIALAGGFSGRFGGYGLIESIKHPPRTDSSGGLAGMRLRDDT